VAHAPSEGREQFTKQWHGPLEGITAPLPRRAKASVLGGGPRIDTPRTDDLFD